MTQSPDIAAEAPRRPVNLIGPAVFAAWLAIGALLARAEAPLVGVLTFAFVMTGWVLSVMVHEFSHALVGWLAGDHTVAAKGYLSFDPRRYGDVGVSLVLPLLVLALGGVGFPGGAVYLRPDLMRGPVWRAAAALAGPAATFLLLVLLALGVRASESAGVVGPLLPALTMLAFLQATALILNLLPIPGLDGFNAIRPFLPPRLAPQIRKAEGLAMVLLFLMLFVLPGASAELFRAAARLSTAFGLDLDMLEFGWRAFHFWR